MARTDITHLEKCRSLMARGPQLVVLSPDIRMLGGKGEGGVTLFSLTSSIVIYVQVLSSIVWIELNIMSVQLKMVDIDDRRCTYTPTARTCQRLWCPT